MIRKYEIINAAIERADRHYKTEVELHRGNKQLYFYNRIYNAEIASFEAGAEWVTSKSSWINTEDDLPYNHKELMYDTWHTKQVFVRIEAARYKSVLFTTSAMINVKTDKKWEWTCGIEYTVTHWMPIPELNE